MFSSDGRCWSRTWIVRRSAVRRDSAAVGTSCASRKNECGSKTWKALVEYRSGVASRLLVRGPSVAVPQIRTAQLTFSDRSSAVLECP